MGFNIGKILKSAAKVALPAALSAIPVVGPALSQGVQGLFQQTAANNQYKSNRKQFVKDREWNRQEKLADRRRYNADEKKINNRERREAAAITRDNRAHAETLYQRDISYFEEQKLGDRAYAQLEKEDARTYDEQRVTEAREYADRINREQRQQYLDDQMEAPARTIEAARAAGINPLTLMGVGGTQQPQAPIQLSAPSSINGGNPGPTPGYASPSFSSNVGGPSSIGGGAAAFSQASAFNQQGFAPLSTVDMITGAVAEAASYFSPERTAQRDNLVLRNELMRVELDKANAKPAPAAAPAPSPRPKQQRKISVPKSEKLSGTKSPQTVAKSGKYKPEFVDGPDGDQHVKATAIDPNGRPIEYKPTANISVVGEVELPNGEVIMAPMTEGEIMDADNLAVLGGAAAWHYRTDAWNSFKDGVVNGHKKKGSVGYALKEKVDQLFGGGDVITIPSLDTKTVREKRHRRPHIFTNQIPRSF